jgi:hypothetical protein
MNCTAGEGCLLALDNRPWWGHRRDAYLRLGYVRDAELRPSEKYNRRPACVAG